MLSQVILTCEFLKAHVTLYRLYTPDAMHCRQVFIKVTSLLEDLGADVTQEAFATDVMSRCHVSLQVVATSKHFGADLTLHGFTFTNAVHRKQVTQQIAFILVDLRAASTLERFSITKSVDSSHVQTHVTTRCKPPAANLTWELGVRMLYVGLCRRHAGVLIIGIKCF